MLISVANIDIHPDNANRERCAPCRCPPEESSGNDTWASLNRIIKKRQLTLYATASFNKLTETSMIWLIMPEVKVWDWKQPLGDIHGKTRVESPGWLWIIGLIMRPRYQLPSQRGKRLGHPQSTSDRQNQATSGFIPLNSDQFHIELKENSIFLWAECLYCFCRENWTRGIEKQND